MPKKEGNLRFWIFRLIRRIRLMNCTQHLIERAAESDESLMEQFFANDTLTPEEFQKGIKAGLLQRGLVPDFLCFRQKEYGCWPSAGIHFPGSTQSE